jgi:hypothetical protein
MFVVALLGPILDSPAKSMPDEGTSAITVTILSSQQGAQELLTQALACHMHFEHQQLLRAENAFAIPIPSPVQACYLTRVNPLASLEPHPPKKPPRT